jgi:E3 ubiquitin-protein ligase ATL6/9/15/31/42/55
MMPDCKHGFHNDCLVKWLETNACCPVCRRKQNIYAEILLSQNESDSEIDDDIDNLFYSKLVKRDERRRGTQNLPQT